MHARSLARASSVLSGMQRDEGYSNPRAFGLERVRGQVFPITLAGIDERAKRRVLARPVRAQCHQPTARLASSARG